MNMLQAKEVESADSHAADNFRRTRRLRNGDCLGREEFERRYHAMPDLKIAELIEGVVHMGSPVSIDHGSSHSDVMTVLGIYRLGTPGVRSYDNAAFRADRKNEFQPDALLRIESGGKSFRSRDGYLEGAPELAAEISVSTASKDLHEKKAVYERCGVQEYLVWQVHKKCLDWFELRQGKYHPLPPDENGVIHSRIFPGLRLKVDALLSGNLSEVAAEVQKGLQTAEHAEFVRSLLEK